MIDKITHIHKSKTAMFALLISILGIVEQNTHLISQDQQGYILMITGILTLLLRFVTTQPIEDK